MGLFNKSKSTEIKYTPEKRSEYHKKYDEYLERVTLYHSWKKMDIEKQIELHDELIERDMNVPCTQSDRRLEIIKKVLKESFEELEQIKKGL